MSIQIDGITIQNNADSTLAGSLTTPTGTNALNVTSIGAYASGLGEETAEVVVYDKTQQKLFVMANFEDAGTPGDAAG